MALLRPRRRRPLLVILVAATDFLLRAGAHNGGRR
jgi:hypothetical protein